MAEGGIVSPPFFPQLSEDDLQTIAEGCYMERIDLCNRIRRQQATIDTISRDTNTEIGSGCPR